MRLSLLILFALALASCGGDRHTDLIVGSWKVEEMPGVESPEIIMDFEKNGYGTFRHATYEDSQQSFRWGLNQQEGTIKIEFEPSESGSDNTSVGILIRGKYELAGDQLAIKVRDDGYKDHYLLIRQKE